VLGIISPQRSHDAPVVGIDPLNILNLILEVAAGRYGEHQLAVGAKGYIRKGHLVHVLNPHRDVNGMRAYITNHHCGTVIQLCLNGKFHLIVLRSMRIGLAESYARRRWSEQSYSLVRKSLGRRSLLSALQKERLAVGAVDE